MKIKRFSVLILILLIVIIVIICSIKNIITFYGYAFPSKENYIFITKWGSQGSESGQFGAGPATWFKIIDKTIRKLEDKFDDEKLKIIISIKDREMLKKELTDILFYKTQLEITEEAIKRLPCESNLEFEVGQKVSGEELRRSKIDIDKLAIIFACSKKLLFFSNTEIDVILRECEQKPGYLYLNGPEYIAVDLAGDVYVSDLYNNCIQKFTSKGDFITKWGVKCKQGKKDNLPGEFNRPSGIAVDREGNVYIADSRNNCIQKFDSEGKFITMWGIKDDSKYFDVPRAIAVGPEGNIYVKDCSEDFIQIFSPDEDFITNFMFSGDLVKKTTLNRKTIINASASGFGNNIAIDKEGNIFVSFLEEKYSKMKIPYNNKKINIFGPGVVKYSFSGRYLTRWGTKGSGDGEFENIGGIATDLKGNIFVVDTGNHRIQKFDNNGRFITKWGKEGFGDGEFLYPTAIVIDFDGNVYVMDTGNYRIQKFAPVCDIK